MSALTEGQLRLVTDTSVECQVRSHGPSRPCSFLSATPHTSTQRFLRHPLLPDLASSPLLACGVAKPLLHLCVVSEGPQ